MSSLPNASLQPNFPYLSGEVLQSTCHKGWEDNRVLADVTASCQVAASSCSPSCLQGRGRRTDWASLGNTEGPVSWVETSECKVSITPVTAPQVFLPSMTGLLHLIKFIWIHKVQIRMKSWTLVLRSWIICEVWRGCRASVHSCWRCTDWKVSLPPLTGEWLWPHADYLFLSSDSCRSLTGGWPAGDFWRRRCGTVCITDQWITKDQQC